MYIKKIAVCLIAFAGLSHYSAQADNKYWQEFQEFKKNPDYKMVFDKEASPLVRNIAAELENAKVEGYWSRWMRPVIHMVGGVIVTTDTMPQMYGYIDTLCKNNGIATPVIAVTKDKGIFNAAAQKLYATSGAIFIGQDLLKELTDEGVEAIIAHEIGHIYHNHVNKMIALNYARMFVLYQLYAKDILSQDQAIWSHLLLPQILIGKRFERQADDFACREAGKAQGIVSSFEYIEEKVKKHDTDFETLYAALQEGSSEIDGDDYRSLWMDYYVAKGFHNLGKGIMWVYHNTPFGPHPSHQARIENAKRILAEQAGQETATA